MEALIFDIEAPFFMLCKYFYYLFMISNVRLLLKEGADMVWGGSDGGDVS